MILAFPFDNTEYGADALGAWLATRTRGVFSTEDNLRVVANNNMTVTVKKGIAWLKMREDWGIVFNNTEDIVLDIKLDDKSQEKVAMVVCQLNKLTSKADIVLRIGEVTDPPKPMRNDQYDEIFLANVWLRQNYTSITSSDIIDLRLDETYCGLMRDGVTQIPTQALQEQAYALINAIRTQLNQLNSGTEAMLKSVYDPTGSGTVSKAVTAQRVPWTGITGKPAERFASYIGKVGSASSGAFNLVGLITAYRMANYWMFDFMGTRFYASGSYPNASEFGFSISTLEGVVGASLKIPTGEVIGNFMAFNGVNSAGVADVSNTGKLMNTSAGILYGGILVGRDAGYLRPAYLRDSIGNYTLLNQSDSMMIASRNDQWTARFYLETDE